MRVGRVRMVPAIAIAVLVLAGTGCSGDEEAPADGGSDSGGALVPGTAALSIADLTFEPAVLPIAAGSTDITITNADTANHTFTLDDGSVDEPVDAGETVTVTVEGESGASLTYHCEIHSSMTGTLQVA